MVIFRHFRSASIKKTTTPQNSALSLLNPINVGDKKDLGGQKFKELSTHPPLPVL